MSSYGAWALEVKGNLGFRNAQPMCEPTKETGGEVSRKLFALCLVAVGQQS